jgi:hypothetical protein
VPQITYKVDLVSKSKKREIRLMSKQILKIDSSPITFIIFAKLVILLSFARDGQG